MTYIVVSENEIVKAEMERPNENNYYRIDGAGIKFIDKDAYYRDRDLFTCHLASLPRIPAPGHKWEMWQSVVEGKDFELKQRKQPSPFCRDCADAEVLGICDYDGFPCNGSAIAIPIQPTPEGGKVEGKDLELFRGDFQAFADRILRDKGASNKDVYDAINDTICELSKQYKIQRL